MFCLNPKIYQFYETTKNTVSNKKHKVIQVVLVFFNRKAEVSTSSSGDQLLDAIERAPRCPEAVGRGVQLPWGTMSAQLLAHAGVGRGRRVNPSPSIFGFHLPPIQVNMGVGRGVPPPLPLNFLLGPHGRRKIPALAAPRLDNQRELLKTCTRKKKKTVTWADEITQAPASARLHTTVEVGRGEPPSIPVGTGER